MRAKFLAILALSLAINLISNDCLAENTLKTLGFSSTQDAEVKSSPEVCTDLFSTSGTCVPEAEVKAKIEADNKNFKASVSVFAKVITELSSLGSLVNIEDDENKKTMDNIMDKAKGSRNNCIKAWSVVQQGVTCYLASGDASNNTSVGANISVNVNRTQVGSHLEACLDNIDLICLMSTGVAISSSMTISEAMFLSKQAEYKSSCEKLRDNYSCDTEECKTARYDTIINIFFKPYNYSFFASVNAFADISDLLNDLADDISDWFENTFSRRLQEGSNVETKSDSDGTDAKKHGENSNVEKVEKGSYILSAVILAFTALLYK